jgi:competence protein ComGC
MQFRSERSTETREGDGFTQRELIVVVLVIVVALAIALPIILTS